MCPNQLIVARLCSAHTDAFCMHVPQLSGVNVCLAPLTEVVYCTSVQPIHTCILILLCDISSQNATANFAMDTYRIAENFQGRKLSRISRFCGYTQKFSPRNLGRGVLWHCKPEQSGRESFLYENRIFTNSRKFLPRKIPAIR